MSDIGAKVEHVKKSRQTRDHLCHWPGCDKQVKPAMWGCVGHWFKLPKHLRDRVWNAYRAGQEDDMKPSRDYIIVSREIREWIKENGRFA